MFGVHIFPVIKCADLFGGKLWCEVDQDQNYGWKTYNEFLTNGNTCLKDTSGFNKAVRNMPVSTVKQIGTGSAVMMNLSPQWYNAYRVAGFEAAKHRDAFMKHVGAAGVKRWVEIENASEQEFGYEVTYFTKPDGRTVLFLCWNPEIEGSQAGGGNAVGLKAGEIDITLKFAKLIRGARNERTGANLGNGDRFKLSWVRNEAIVISFGD